MVVKKPPNKAGFFLRGWKNWGKPDEMFMEKLQLLIRFQNITDRSDTNVVDIYIIMVKNELRSNLRLFSVPICMHYIPGVYVVYTRKIGMDPKYDGFQKHFPFNNVDFGCPC